ncbi:MAG TPA: tRNA (adenosine(37)-N6)-threonylcarbamoyltransferase complex dimerization subunit type 1 TsaB [Bryobacteraceae bacterium]|nr:tRNA (adenosine(37)-N6)-threonylcarbamoyltransferase complex dimerization subunit type 1 TsaB [Bryobacteraceae bacterium]
MRVLALDTATSRGSIALLNGATVVREETLRAPAGFSEIVFGSIDAILKTSGWSLDQVDLFAATSGPGSFTGVRIGLSAIKALAYATGKPAVGISTLRALAACGSKPRRAVLLDARRGEVYAGLYDSDFHLVSPEVVLDLETWFLHFSGHADELLIRDLAESVLPSVAIPLSDPLNLAGAVGRVAFQDVTSNQQDRSPDLIDANYVRRADAELKWVDR